MSDDTGDADRLAYEAALMWSHVPKADQPPDNAAVEFMQAKDGHLAVRHFPSGGEVEDVYYLRGLDPGEEPCVFRVRSWLADATGGEVDTGRRLTTAWRDGEPLGEPLNEDPHSEKD